jgi:hypothetical protein
VTCTGVCIGYSSKLVLTRIYSFAIILWELLTLAEPFAEYPQAKGPFMSLLEDAIIGGLRPTLPKNCRADYRSLVESAWADDPTKRPSFDVIYAKLNDMRESSKVFTNRKPM